MVEVNEAADHLGNTIEDICENWPLAIAIAFDGGRRPQAIIWRNFRQADIHAKILHRLKPTITKGHCVITKYQQPLLGMCFRLVILDDVSISVESFRYGDADVRPD